MRTSAPGQSALMMADIAGPLEARGVRYAVIGFADATLEIVGREDFIAMKAFAGGPVDLADVRVIIVDLDRGRSTWLCCGDWRSDSVAMQREQSTNSSAGRAFRSKSGQLSEILGFVVT